MAATITETREEAKSKTKEESSKRDLLAIDRCDRCYAPAQMRAVHPNQAAEILFCMHHGKKHSIALELQGFEIDDQSERLYTNTRPDSGSAAG